MSFRGTFLAMGHKTRGGYWCDFCGQPVAGEKATHRMRGAAGILAAGVTGGASLIGAVPGSYHCPNCGNRVRPATAHDYAALDAAVHQAQIAAEDAVPRPNPPAEQRPAPTEDWRSAPSGDVPPWRRRDRDRLDSQDRRRVQQELKGRWTTGLAEQLKELASLHAAGALSDEEFSVAKSRLLHG